MTASEFRAHLSAIGWGREAFARVTGINVSTVSRMANGARQIPEPLAVWVERVAAWHAANPPPVAPVYQYVEEE